MDLEASCVVRWANAETVKLPLGYVLKDMQKCNAQIPMVDMAISAQHGQRREIRCFQSQVPSVQTLC